MTPFANDTKCTWCGEELQADQPANQWTWDDSGTEVLVTVHLECQDAMDQRDDLQDGFDPHQNNRGCYCGRWLYCQEDVCVKARQEENAK